MKFWGYIHSNGTLQVKRCFGDHELNIKEANESPFVVHILPVIEAPDIEEARLEYHRKYMEEAKKMTDKERIQLSYKKTKTYLEVYVDRLQSLESKQSLLGSFIKETENEELKDLFEEIRISEVILQDKIRKNRKLILDIVKRETD